MTRTLTRNSALRRGLSLWVAFAFVLSLTNVGFAVPVEAPEGEPAAVEEVVAPVPGDEAPGRDKKSEKNPKPVEEPAVQPAEEPAEEPQSEEPQSGESPEPSEVADPVTPDPSGESVERPSVKKAVKPVAAASVVAPLALVTPTEVDGNPPLGAGGLRIDESELPGTFTHTYMGVEITVTVTLSDTSDGEEFAFTSTYPVIKVVAKGGNGANIYEYSPGVLADSGLHAPLNPSEKWADISHIDFYFVTPADVEVIKFHDLDGDGMHDDGEPTLDGWMIRLLQGDAVVDSGLTVGGKVVFDNIAPGVYHLDEVLADGWQNTTPLPKEIVVVPGQDATYKIGNRTIPDVEKTFSLTFEGAPAGVEFFAHYRLGEGGFVEVALAPVGDGVFTGSVELPYGSVIEEVVWLAKLGGMTYVLGSDVELEERLVEDITNRFTYTASIAGSKFGDDDADGTWDEGEVGLAGWTIGLYRAVPQVELAALPAPQPGFELVATTVTGPGGAYSFSGLLPGVYYVAEEMQDGWIQTLAPEGTFEVSNGTARTGLDFGNAEEILPFTAFEFDKSADKTVAETGDLITYTLTYRLAPDSAAWTDPIPVIDDYDERYVTPVDVAGGTVADGKITWVDNEDLLDGQERTIVYTMRVKTGLPVGTTIIDNVALLDVQQGYEDDWTVRVTVEEADEEEPFLPFTGGEWMPLALAALAAAFLGITLRRLGARQVT